MASGLYPLGPPPLMERGDSAINLGTPETGGRKGAKALVKKNKLVYNPFVNERQGEAAAAEGVITLDDTKTRIILAAIKAVRQYGLEGVRIQIVGELAGISSGAIYRHFDSKDQLLAECFTYVDRQAAAIFEHLKFNPLVMLTDPMGTVKGLWLPYFRFWTSHPDETVFYHRFRDSTFFPQYDRERDSTYFKTFAGMVHVFMVTFPSLRRMNQDLLWLHVLTSTVMYAKYVVEGTLPNNQETEDTVFQLLATGLSGYLKPDSPPKSG